MCLPSGAGRQETTLKRLAQMSLYRARQYDNGAQEFETPTLLEQRLTQVLILEKDIQGRGFLDTGAGSIRRVGGGAELLAANIAVVGSI